MNHFILIRSAYRDEGLSRQRLALSQRTIIPCLKRQTQKTGVICLRVDRNDPLLQPRIAAFENTGFNVQTNWNLPDGPRLTTRVDDDDAIANWFLEDTLAETENMDPADPTVLSWPNGYVWCGRRLRQWSLPENMFISLLSETGCVMDFKHRRTPYRISRIAQRRAWVWVRHTTNKSDLAPNHLKNPPYNVDPSTLPFAVDWGRI